MTDPVLDRVTELLVKERENLLSAIRNMQESVDKQAAALQEKKYEIEVLWVRVEHLTRELEERGVDV